ncbi:purine and uridine phosphorylase [Hyaloraphidium curvatum]|nr:purine and uridine phosphorylase [Hyaloraphidium curvatum]
MPGSANDGADAGANADTVTTIPRFKSHVSPPATASAPSNPRLLAPSPQLNLTVAASFAGFADANFPLDDAGRTYHVGLKRGEVCNRILTVGDTTRALQIATHLDAHPQPFAHTSKRHFTTVTGRFRGVPVSILAIGMGGPNMDFFVREVREVVDGPMAVIRLGTCGCVGSFELAGPNGGGEDRTGKVAVADECVLVERNYDYFLDAVGEPYRVSRAVPGDARLTAGLKERLEARMGSERVMVGLNAAADSFYGSQARRDRNTVDANHDLLRTVREKHPGLLTFEMETYHLFSFGLVCLGRDLEGSAEEIIRRRNEGGLKPTVLAAGAHIVVADRVTNDFIAPAVLLEAQKEAGMAALEALAAYEFEEGEEALHPERGSVWEL